MFNEVYLMDVFSSAREKEQELLQKKVDRYFRKYKKYDENILNMINMHEKDVWIFLGAGTCNEILEKFKKEHF